MEALKKQLIIWSAVLLSAVVVAFLLPRLKLLQNAGYVLIGWGRWEIELTAVTLILIFIVGFVLFYAAIRLTALLIRLPVLLRQRREQAQADAAFQKLLHGLKEAAEGNWEQAEKILIEGAALSGQALVHYLTAARAAHQRGALRQRDEYLKKAREIEPDAEVAVKLTEAELHVANEDFDQALKSLQRLEKIAPANAQALRLMHQVYTRLGKWDALTKLLPRLRKNQALLEAEVRLMEMEAYSALLRKAAKMHDPKALEEAWQKIPDPLRKEADLQAIYFAAMIEAGAGEAVEPELRRTLTRHWNETLLVLYGALELPDAAAQLAHAETWLKRHGDDPILLRVLGKLALRAGELDKAEDYLTRSLEKQPTAETYRLLGDLFLQRGESDKAAECYRRGLMLASKAVIEEVEAHPEGG